MLRKILIFIITTLLHSLNWLENGILSEWVFLTRHEKCGKQSLSGSILKFPFPTSFRVNNPRGWDFFFVNSARLKLFCTCKESFLVNNYASTLFEVKWNFFLLSNRLFVEDAIFEAGFSLLLWVSYVLETKGGGPMPIVPRFSRNGLLSFPAKFTCVSSRQDCY